ncbi:MAG: YodC family protein [Desulfarculus sp.]|nr:YodC family protein [Pseudomonadota bacterium]MBV1717465.1 YodC family protein [Desulfarculus sp.]MBU4573924.1 YodC family protein [Pseudomonadota bacterium]MBU4598761.1 YodC family protein [Pseudomonadota bacterium]MBV1740035.1 YodC family protein [Desulfarculus sp.]
MATVKEGDVVRLKSGGPQMTVKFVDREFHSVVCQWFEGHKLAEGNFSPESLELDQ